MNRRKFLTRSSLGLLAATSLPKAILNKSTDVSIYKTKLETNTAGQTYYELQIDHTAIWHTETASETVKTILIKVAYFDTADVTKPKNGVSVNYIIQDVSKEDVAGENLYTIHTKFDKKISGDAKLAKQFPKEMMIKGKVAEYFELYGKSGDVIINIPYPPQYGDEDGCFLTTACVEHKHLADDCDELTTLRFLRDNYMKHDAEGALLAADYKIIGPEIVKTINGFDNKAEIYNYMYQHLVEPSVKLIKAKKYAEATMYYKDFVAELMNQYL